MLRMGFFLVGMFRHARRVQHAHAYFRRRRRRSDAPVVLRKTKNKRPEPKTRRGYSIIAIICPILLICGRSCVGVGRIFCSPTHVWLQSKVDESKDSISECTTICAHGFPCMCDIEHYTF